MYGNENKNDEVTFSHNFFIISVNNLIDYFSMYWLILFILFISIIHIILSYLSHLFNI